MRLTFLVGGGVKIDDDVATVNEWRNEPSGGRSNGMLLMKHRLAKEMGSCSEGGNWVKV